MPLTYPTFAQLDQSRVNALKTLLQQVLQEYNPDLDARMGFLQTALLQPAGLLTAVEEGAVENMLASSSLATVAEDPSIADAATVAQVLGNYRLTQSPGSVASGTVTIVLTELVATIIPANAIFTIGGLTFATTKSWAGRTSSEDVIAPTDVLITAIGGGDYAFTLSVSAAAIGTAGNVAFGSSAVPAQPPLFYASAFVAADFTGGSDAQTVADMVDVWESGLAARAWNNRPGVLATLLNQPTFAGLVAVSVIGFLDPEMLRDNHSLLPTSTGGRADLYALTQAGYITLTLTKTATLISKSGAVGTWQLNLLDSDAPGYYEVVSIQLPGSNPLGGSFSITNETRSLNLSTTPPPDLVNLREGVFSVYQAGSYQFIDTTTNASALTINVSQQTYTVLATCMPLLAPLQQFWLDRNNAPPSGDVLVKAPIPCFVSYSATLNVPTGTTVNVAALQTTVAQAINNLGFVGTLAASYISQVLHNALPALSAITGANLTGRIRKPDLSQAYLSATTALTIPADYSNMLSGRTAAFLTTAASIALTVAYT